jgi:hypothetical protein
VPSLFQLVSGSSGTLGADAFTVYQVLMIMVYLTGLYSYLTYQQEVREMRTEFVLTGTPDV